MSERCEQFGRWIGGCKFAARYDEEPMAEQVKIDGFTGDAHAFRDSIVRRVYVGDICIRCGEWSPRPEEPRE